MKSSYLIGHEYVLPPPPRRPHTGWGLGWGCHAPRPYLAGEDFRKKGVCGSHGVLDLTKGLETAKKKRGMTSCHVMSCHGALEPFAGPPSGRPSAERLAVTHTHALRWNGPQVRGSREHHAWREGKRCPDQARPITGMRADAQRHQSRRQAPAFWELVGLTLDSRRAHSRHTW